MCVKGKNAGCHILHFLSATSSLLTLMYLLLLLSSLHCNLSAVSLYCLSMPLLCLQVQHGLVYCKCIVHCLSEWKSMGALTEIAFKCPCFLLCFQQSISHEWVVVDIQRHEFLKLKNSNITAYIWHVLHHYLSIMTDVNLSLSNLVVKSYDFVKVWWCC